MNAGRARSRQWGFRLAGLVLPCAIAVVAWVTPLARAQDSTGGPPIPPAPTHYVVDQADVIDASTEAQLEGYLDQLETKTGIEFAVLTMPNTAPIDPTQYKTQVYQKWGGHREGLLMLVAMEERTITFETGYEVEGTLPDGLQSRIIREEMVPRFRAGDVAGGIVAGVVECGSRIAKEKGVTVEWNGRTLREPRATRKKMPFWVVLLIFFIIMSIVSRTSGGGRGRRRGGGWWIGPMGGMGGGWGGWTGGLGGGGFGGGSGGGGSFGGFGGGFGSGGGGGSGRW